MDDSMLQKLTTGSQRLVAAVEEKQKSTGQAVPGINLWLLAVVERHAPMIQSLTTAFDLEKALASLPEDLKNNRFGPALAVEEVVQRAAERAGGRGKSQASEIDVVAVVLLAAGFAVPGSIAAAAAPKSATGVETPFARQSGEVKAAAPTPTLEKFGRNLTQAAREGKLTPMIGREDELQLMVETLCRRTKRNPVLIGPAGVGKTAVVEGLAQRVASGQVPELLHGAEIFALQPSNLVAGASVSGELEKRMQAVVKEASQAGILLFIDEIHSIMGAGGMLGLSDMASILKPALARGEMACIAATTDDEYRRYIENDSALERRFQPIRIHELTPEQTLLVLYSLRESIQATQGIQIDDNVLAWLVDFAHQSMRNRHFPDKAVDLLEQSVAHALTKDQKIVTLEDARNVAQRMVGMPLALEERLKLLTEALNETGMLSEREITTLANRLQVTMRGLDLRSSRPNVVALLTGDAKENSLRLAETTAKALFGASDRVISIDFSRFLHPEDINLLVGAPPGYVGYSDSLPLHRLAQIPWCVLRLENIDACHPYVREVLAQALKDGWIMDGRGRQLFLSDAVVFVTADLQIETHRSLGFFQAEENEVSSDDIRDSIVQAVGADLEARLDLLLWGQHAASRSWLEGQFLSDLHERYSKQGIDIEWDKTLVDWLVNATANGVSDTAWEHWVDNVLTPAMIPYLSKAGQHEMKVLAKMAEGKLAIVNADSKEEN